MSAGADDGAQHFGIDDVRLADEAEIDGFALQRVRVELDALELLRDDEVAVFAGNADSPAARRVDAADDLLVDRAGQHHLDDFDGGGIGDAQAVDESGRDREPLQHRADLRAAAMHHDGIDPGLLHQHDVLREVLRHAAFHGVAAIFHDDRLAVIFQDVGQRLDQHARGRAPARQRAQVRVQCAGIVLKRHVVPRSFGLIAQ